MICESNGNASVMLWRHLEFKMKTNLKMIILQKDKCKTKKDKQPMNIKNKNILPIVLEYTVNC